MQQQDNRENYSVGLHKLRSAPKVIGMIKSREMRCDMYGDTGNAYRVLVRKLEGRRPLARSGRRCKDSIKTDHKYSGCDGMGWIHPD